MKAAHNALSLLEFLIPPMCWVQLDGTPHLLDQQKKFMHCKFRQIPEQPFQNCDHVPFRMMNSSYVIIVAMGTQEVFDLLGLLDWTLPPF